MTTLSVHPLPMGQFEVYSLTKAEALGNFPDELSAYKFAFGYMSAVAQHYEAMVRGPSRGTYKRNEQQATALYTTADYLIRTRYKDEEEKSDG
jgi:hypothetical protein